jgi:hypothetical protein
MTSNREVETFFFRAMQAGYAKGTKPEPVPDMPGFKQLAYKEAYFSLLDRWGTRDGSSSSSGTTTIWSREVVDHIWQPAWVMNYTGQYDQGAIQTLKNALLSAYSKRLFRGGRGPEFFRRGEHVYINSVEREGFTNFSGREEIFSFCGGSCGWHEYSGKSFME